MYRHSVYRYTPTEEETTVQWKFFVGGHFSKLILCTPLFYGQFQFLHFIDTNVHADIQYILFNIEMLFF